MVKEKKIYLILILSSILILSRIILIEHYLLCDADESVIGIMAKHFAENKNMPYYMYGQTYNGGAVIESFFASFIYKITNSLPVSLKLNAIIIYAIFSVICALLIKKIYGLKFSFIIFLILLFSPQSIHRSFTNYGYLILSLNNIIIFSLLYKTIYENRISKNIYLLFFFCGIGLWIFEHSILTLLTTLIILLLKHKIKNFVKIFFVGLPFLITGYLPTIFFNFHYNFVNWKLLLFNSIQNIKYNIYEFFIFKFPVTFSGMNINDYRLAEQQGVPIYCYLISYLFIVCSIIFIIFYLKKIKKINFSNNEFITKFMLILFVFINLIFYFVNGEIFNYPRYYWMIFPFQYIILIYVLFKIKFKNKIYYKPTQFIIIFVLGAYLVLGYKNQIKNRGIDCRNSIDEYKLTEYNTVFFILNKLEKDNIRFIKGNYFLIWPIIFHSNEKIIGLPIDIQLIRIPEYLYKFKTKKTELLILFNNDPILKKINLNAIKKIVYINNIVLLYL
jgi:hypothetical protein